MSHISVDLKVIEVLAPMVARAAEQPVTHVLGGLNLLWHRCWSTKTDTVSRIGLAGVFGPGSLTAIIDAMVDAGLLEPRGDAWRVRGADKYLRIDAARSKGGKAAAGNLKKGTKRPDAFPGSSRESAGDQPERTSRLTPGSSPGLTPSTEHRTPEDRGSMSSPLEQPRAGATPTLVVADEDKDSRWVKAADDFVAWAREVDGCLADPGPAVTDWAREFFLKHQPSDVELVRKAFMRFVVWASTNRKTVGWGLWLSERVHEPRWAEVRAERGAA